MTGVPRYFFMEKNNVQILEQPIEAIAVSDSCKLYLKGQGFNNLKEVISQGWDGLRKMENFDYIRFNEIIRFLDTKNLLPLMERQF